MTRLTTRTALALLATGLAATLTACADATAAPLAHEPATTAPVPTGPPLADGRHEVHVVGADDSDGLVLVLDPGRFVVGAPTEPGVDSTAPISFDTGRLEHIRTGVAADPTWVLHVGGSGATVTTTEALVEVVNTSTDAFLAVVTVSGGEVVELEQLYRA